MDGRNVPPALSEKRSSILVMGLSYCRYLADSSPWEQGKTNVRTQFVVTIDTETGEKAERYSCLV
jgi:hypothetical protein